MMKRLYPAVWLLIALFAAPLTLQAQSDVVNLVKETIKAGSSKELSRYMGETVDVALGAKVETYSRAQAEFVLRDFFKQHPPKDFNIIHQGSSKGGLPYAIGEYTSEGESYRVFIKIKNFDDVYLVNEIRFDKE